MTSRLRSSLLVCVICALAVTSACAGDLSFARGFAIAADGIGRDYPVEALYDFVTAAGVRYVVLDWDCIPQTWPQTNAAAVTDFANRLAAAGVKVAAMYRPRFSESPTVPTQVKTSGAAAEHDGFAICYSSAPARKWAVSWIAPLLALSPAFTEVIINQPRDICHCRLCGERPNDPFGVPTPGVVKFLGEAREAVHRCRPDASFGLVGGITARYWEPALEAIDLAHPGLLMSERADPVRNVAFLNALRPTLGTKLDFCLTTISGDIGLCVAPAVLAQQDREAARTSLPYVLSPFNTAFLSDDYDSKAVAEALSLNWPALQPCLGRMANEADANDGVPLVTAAVDRPDLQPIPGKYVVVSGVPATSPYYEAAKALADYRKVPVITLPLHPAQTLYESLQALRAEQIAIIAPPADVVADVVNAVFLAAVNMDHDPDLDSTYGFITGATAKDALGMVQHTIEAEANRPTTRRALCIGHVFDGMDHCFKAMERRAADYRRMGMEADTIRYDDADKEWTDRKLSEMAKFDSVTTLVFCGHGSGRWAAGIRGADCFRVQVNRALVFSGTCMANAVCEMWLEGADKRLRRTPIAPEDSVTLGLIHAGAIGLVGSVCSSSFAFVSEAMNAVDRGLTLGEAFRAGQNFSIARARLKSVVVYPFVAGQPSPQSFGTRAHRQANAIGPVALFGDPAYLPYPGGLPNHAVANAQPLFGATTTVTATTPPEELKLTPGTHEYVMRPSNGVSAMILQYMADRSFPTAPYAAVSDNLGVRALLRFDLARVSLPAGTTLKRATLRLYAQKPVSAPEPGLRPLGLHQVTTAWKPEVTWSTAPAFDPTPQQIQLFENKVTWVEYDLTKQAQGWLAEPASNFGVMLKFVTENQKPWVSWNLAGPKTEDDALRPRIVFECE